MGGSRCLTACLWASAAAVICSQAAGPENSREAAVTFSIHHWAQSCLHITTPNTGSTQRFHPDPRLRGLLPPAGHHRQDGDYKHQEKCSTAQFTTKESFDFQPCLSHLELKVKPAAKDLFLNPAEQLSCLERVEHAGRCPARVKQGLVEMNRLKPRSWMMLDAPKT